MKRVFAAVMALCLLLSGCAVPRQAADTTKQYTATFLTLFDTVTTIIGRAESEDAFQKQAQAIHDDLLYYHELFDIYNEYDGVNNLKTVNDNAGIAPVKVDSAIIALLKDCRTYYELTGGKVNVAMGSVLRLWHEARKEGINDPAHARLPETAALEEAAEHCSFDSVIIDEAASTVYLSDPDASLDVGAVAKGWSAQRVAESAPQGMLISVGGNVCATGPKLTDGTPWVIGIQDPDQPDKNLHTVFVKEGCVVTSGDYQRAYMVDGKRYHHIIDPETRMPSAWWRSVSVIGADSGLGDALSTALFLMDREEGLALAQRCGVQVLWVDPAGEEYMTSGFEEIMRT